ncbi:hypothetical protein BVI2075_150076 [Burkholderia vietnamiensis]|nr:hypothetical protein BVI2075_150076 [Burkholderia vietnamiensis]
MVERLQYRRRRAPINSYPEMSMIRSKGEATQA